MNEEKSGMLLVFRYFQGNSSKYTVKELNQTIQPSRQLKDDFVKRMGLRLFLFIMAVHVRQELLRLGQLF